MKTTVELSNALFRAAKKYAAEKGMTFRELVEAGLKMVLGSGKSPQKKFKLKKATFGGNGLAAEVKKWDWEQIRDLIYEGRGS